MRTHVQGERPGGSGPTTIHPSTADTSQQGGPAGAFTAPSPSVWSLSTVSATPIRERPYCPSRIQSSTTFCPRFQSDRTESDRFHFVGRSLLTTFPPISGRLIEGFRRELKLRESHRKERSGDQLQKLRYRRLLLNRKATALLRAVHY